MSSFEPQNHSMSPCSSFQENKRQNHLDVLTEDSFRKEEEDSNDITTLFAMELSNSQVVHLSWTFIRYIFLAYITRSKATLSDTLIAGLITLLHIFHLMKACIATAAHLTRGKFICLFMPCELKVLWSIFHKTLNLD